MPRLNPAITYNIDDFISMKLSDDLTFYNFSILEKFDGVEHLDHNLVEEYIDELDTIEVPLTVEQYKRYKYKPDLLAYDIYGSTQLDFIVLMCNDMIDPKEFDKMKVKLPYASVLSKFLDQVYSTNYNYIQQNRELNNIQL